MSDTLNIFGTTYTGVNGIIAKDNNDTDKTYIRPQGAISITSNGTGIDVSSYATANVSVSGGSPTLETITKTYTPTTSQQTDTITASSGYDGIEEVDVTVNAVPTASFYTYAEDLGFATENNVRKWKIRGASELDPNEGDIEGWVGAGAYAGEIQKYNAVASGTTITPTESQQTVGGVKYMMEGAVTVGAISSNYVGSGITQRSSSDLSASGATVTVPSGYYASQATKSVSSGSATPASSISGTSATVSTGTNTLTLSKTISNTPQVSAGYISSGTAGNSSVSLTASVTTKGATTYNTSSSDQTIASGTYLTGTQTIRGVTTSNLTADNIKNGVTVTVGDSADADRVLSVTGTYSGGGTSKNVQVLQSTSRTNSSSLTKVLGDLTVTKTGTYDVYWSGGRTNTSTSYTWGTRLYVDGTGYGTENTTWSNNCQSNHLSNVSLTANQKLSVYARGRTGSYYTFAPMLAIVEA